MKARIHPSVRPYGGREFPVVDVRTYPNGRKVVILDTGGSADNGDDWREYNEFEVQILRGRRTQ